MSHKEFWINILRRLQPTIKKAHFLTWFQNTIVNSIKDDTLTITVPTVYARKWLSEKYDLKIFQAAQELDSSIKSIKYKVSSKVADEAGDGIDVQTLFSAETEKKTRKVKNLNELNIVKAGSDEKISSQMLNNRYKLNNFVVGSDNRLPHAACQAVANMPGGIYNPLYIYGNVGLGKTHLLQAVGNEILTVYPDMLIKYLTAERFVTEVVEAIGRRHMKKFKEQYRNVDCLLIDDVQFFARKNSSQQEFFHTFNELYDNNKQIILTSDRAPSELDDLDDRLKSRFGMGMVVELIAPDFETRLAILNQKAKEFQLILDPDVLHFIANNINNNVRELEGVLRQLVAEVQLFERVPTIKSVAEIIKRMNKAQKIIGYDVDEKSDKKVVKNSMDIINVVASYYNVAVEEMLGKDRHKEFMIPRQISMYLIKNELGHSYERIGAGFGGRNHTTVMHSCNKTTKMLRKDLRLIRDINSIKRDMGL